MVRSDIDGPPDWFQGTATDCNPCEASRQPPISSLCPACARRDPFSLHPRAHIAPRLLLLRKVPAMIRWTRMLALLLCAATFAGSAFADSSKLNARARIAVAQLEAGRAPKALAAEGAAVNDEGQLDVFITGPVSRAELEAAGARVR